MTLCGATVKAHAASAALRSMTPCVSDSSPCMTLRVRDTSVPVRQVRARAAIAALRQHNTALLRALEARGGGGGLPEHVAGASFTYDHRSRCRQCICSVWR